MIFARKFPEMISVFSRGSGARFSEFIIEIIFLQCKQALKSVRFVLITNFVHIKGPFYIKKKVYYHCNRIKRSIFKIVFMKSRVCVVKKISSTSKDSQSSRKSQSLGKTCLEICLSNLNKTRTQHIHKLAPIDYKSLPLK